MSKPRPTEAAAQTPSAAGHEANGRFARGNPGGPGNPFARRVAALRKVIIDNVSEEDLPAITEALKAKAKGGNVAAAKLLLAYAIGKPASLPDPDRLDGHELAHFKEKVETVEQVQELAKEVELALTPPPGPMSTDYALLVSEMVRHPERHDNPVCCQALVNALNDSDTSEGAKPVWAPPSINGFFGELPPRIRQLARALFELEGPSPNGDLPSLNGESPSINGALRPPEET